MGQSTDAILVWGFDIGDAEELPEEVAKRIDHLLDEGYDELESLQRLHGVELVQHCSGSCPHYIVGIEATKTVAWRGHPKTITSLDLPGKTCQAALDAFAQAIGVEAKPGAWLLASDWS